MAVGLSEDHVVRVRRSRLLDRCGRLFDQRAHVGVDALEHRQGDLGERIPTAGAGRQADREHHEHRQPSDPAEKGSDVACAPRSTAHGAPPIACPAPRSSVW